VNLLRNAWWWLLDQWEDSLPFKAVVVLLILSFGTVGVTLAAGDDPATRLRPSPQIRQPASIPTASVPLPGPTTQP
jgi:hypothetical protein